MPVRRLQPVHRFAAAISLLGLVLDAVVVVRTHHLVRPGAGLFALLLMPGVLVGELLPLKIPRRGDDEEITVSTTFSFAVLLSAGLPAALLAQVVASVVQDVVARKPLWRAAFNAGQYTLALVAAAGVTALASFDGSMPFGPDDLPAVAAGGATFFLVNFGVVGTAIALYQRTSLQKYMRSDFVFSLYVGAVLLCLAPVLLTAIRFTPWLYPACLVPMLAIYQGGRQASVSERHATHDALTALPNRARLRELIARAIGEPDGDPEPFAVMLMDLDRFKEINDTLGHHYGDLLLQLVAARLRGSVREGDVVGRLGGDEFVVLVSRLPDEDAAASVAERIGEALVAPFQLEDLAVEAGASIGIAAFPRDGGDVDTLLQRADIAMYHAKRNHLPHAEYDAEHDHHSPAQLALAGDLRRALGGDELEPYYQMLVDLDLQRVTSVEALARWQHPALGLLQPSAFIELAEGTGLIRSLTLRILERALQDRRRWAAGGLDLKVAVNVSMRTLLDRSFPDAVAGALERFETPADRLKLEITESTIMADPATATAVLDVLAGMGISLAIDDFGTGYSSLSYLKQLPVSELKIDRSFVGELGSDADSALIVRSTIELGHNLGLRVIAEGIEDAATLAYLRRLECDGAQGYHLSRPLPGDQVPAAAAMLASQLFTTSLPRRHLREVG